MSIYTEQERDKLIGTPIVEVLAHFGKDCRDRGKGMFLSPLRDETDPSFHVSFKSNTWYDFGMGIGGGVIDLVCRLSGCERKDALDTLSIINGRYPDVTREFQTTRRASAKESAINPNLTASLDVTRHSDTGSFYLIACDPSRLKSHKAVLTVSNCVTAASLTLKSSALYSAEFHSLRH